MLLVAVHEMIGASTGQPALWSITPLQGEKLTDAGLGVLKEYKIKPNPKTIALMNLAAVLGAVYTPKVLMAVSLAKENKPAKTAAPYVVKGEPKAGAVQYDEFGNVKADKIVL